LAERSAGVPGATPTTYFIEIAQQGGAETPRPRGLRFQEDSNMKRLTILLLALAFPVAAMGAAAASHQGHQMAAHKAEAPKTLTGELIDTGCYLAHGARGEKHVECATKCINEGMPMGLLTSDGALYLLTMNHDNPDPYNQLKTMAGKTVSVTGMVATRSGMKGIDVASVKEAEAAAK
jgi:hypothetical protein